MPYSTNMYCVFKLFQSSRRNQGLCTGQNMKTFRYHFSASRTRVTNRFESHRHSNKWCSKLRATNSWKLYGNLPIGHEGVNRWTIAPLWERVEFTACVARIAVETATEDIYTSTKAFENLWRAWSPDRLCAITSMNEQRTFTENKLPKKNAAREKCLPVKNDYDELARRSARCTQDRLTGDQRNIDLAAGKCSILL